MSKTETEKMAAYKPGIGLLPFGTRNDLFKADSEPARLVRPVFAKRDAAPVPTAEDLASEMLALLMGWEH